MACVCVCLCQCLVWFITKKQSRHNGGSSSRWASENLYFACLHGLMYIILSHLLPSLLSFIYTSMISSSHLPLYPSILFSTARVFIFAQPTAECLTRWKKLGVKRQYCCQLWSLSPSLSLSRAHSDSRYISANVLLTSSPQMEYQQKLLSIFSLKKKGSKENQN